MPTDSNKTPEGQRVWPFPEAVPGTAQGDGEASAQQQAADADLLGDAVTMKPPTSTQGPAAAGREAGKAGTAPGPADDENQPGFLGERNSPHAA